MAKIQIIPDHDTYADETAKDTVRGNDDTLIVKSYLGSRRPLYFKWSNTLIWNYISEGTKINEVILKVYIYQISIGDLYKNAPILRVASDWDEATLTWNNRPAVTGSTINTIDFDSVGWKSADITDIFKAWHSEEENNYGVRIWIDSTTVAETIWMYSSEAESNKPYIEVDYIPKASAGILNWWFFRGSWEKHDKIFKPKLVIPNGYTI